MLDIEGRPKIRGLARSNTTYVAVGAAPNTTQGAIYASSDGVAWSLANGTFPAPFTDVAYGNGVFVAIVGGETSSADTGAAYASNDGQSWRRFPVGVGALAPCFSFGNGVFLALSDVAAHRSSDGESWATLALPSAPTGLAGTKFAAGVFAASGRQDQSVALTTTGDSWTVVKATTGGHWISRLFSVNDRFVGLTWYACCFGETGGPWYSTIASEDGLVWTQTPVTQFAAAPVPILEDDHLCVMLGQSNVNTGPSCANLPWTDSSRFGTSAALKGDGFYLLAGNGILYGTNGSDWKQVIDP